MPRRPPKNRRDFLRGQTAAGSEVVLKAVQRTFALEDEGAAQPDSDPTGEPYLVRVGRRAMACQFQVFLNAGEHAGGCEAAVAALDVVDRLEAQMTIFRPDSELSEINRQAADGPIGVEPRLFGLLEQSVELSRATDGAFDITAGPLSEAWGFARRQGRVPGDEELAAALQSVGSRFLRLDPEAQTVEFLRSGMRINLGAIGKGHALDRAAACLEDSGVGDFLFHGGQSSVLARGRHSAGGSEGWTVGLVHPLRPQRRLGEIRLRHRALSTSGSGTQFFTHRGRRYGHILDPRSGRPAEGMLSATVLAPTAAEADALSTALFVLGPERAAELCRNHAEISAILIWLGSRSGTIEMATCHLGDEDFRPLVV